MRAPTGDANPATVAAQPFAAGGTIKRGARAQIRESPGREPHGKTIRPQVRVAEINQSQASKTRPRR